MKILRFLLLLLPGMLLPLAPLHAQEGNAPADPLKELKDREDKVKAIVQKVMPCVVAVTSADPEKPGSGSGVIISSDGLILTAAHVTQATGNDLIIIFPDGRREKGTSLGANRTTDAGMARLTGEGEFPYVEMGSSDLLALGQWVIAMGHPGGYEFDRRPPVRLGRVWRRDLDGAIFTSCPLIGGDSGGPLFDLEGRVVGIHSSIHGSVEMNRHVAIDTLRFDWDKLSKDQTWGQVSFNSSFDSRPITGALFDRDSREGVLVKEVFADLPASKAGIKPGDVVQKFDGETVATFHALQRLIGRRKPGDTVPVALKRGDQNVDLELELGRRFLPRRDGNGNEFGEDGDEAPPPPLPKIPEPSGPRPWLGAAIDADENGVRLGDLTPDGPASMAGLQEGDLLTRINETIVQDPTEVAETLLAMKPDDVVSFHVQRGNESLKIEVKLGQK